MRVTERGNGAQNVLRRAQGDAAQAVDEIRGGE